MRRPAARYRVDIYMCLCYNVFIFFTGSVGLIVLPFGIMYIYVYLCILLGN